MNDAKASLFVLLFGLATIPFFYSVYDDYYHGIFPGDFEPASEEQLRAMDECEKNEALSMAYRDPITVGQVRHARSRCERFRAIAAREAEGARVRDKQLDAMGIEGGEE